MLKLSLVLFMTIFVVNAGDHQHQGYFQYANVPAYGQYEFGYNRGNQHHYTSRYEQGHDWRFRSKVRWGDQKGGYGEHYWDYNHVDKGHQGKGKGHGWGEQGHEQHGHGHGGYEHQNQGIGHGHDSHGHNQYGHGHGNSQGAFSEVAPAVISRPINPK